MLLGTSMSPLISKSPSRGSSTLPETAEVTFFYKIEMKRKLPREDKRRAEPFVPEGHAYPMVWCGAILPPMHRHRYTQYDNTLTRVWHEAYEDDMKIVLK